MIYLIENPSLLRADHLEIIQQGMYRGTKYGTPGRFFMGGWYPRNQLRQEGNTVPDKDMPRLSPLIRVHINMLGRYSVVVPDSIIKGELRPLGDPKEESSGSQGKSA